MEYVARHFIPLKKGLVTPGEILSDLPEELIPRLLERGAIEEIAPVPAAAVKPDKKKPEKAEKTEEPESVPENVEVEAEAETEEAEVEIDALDGVVTAPKEEKPKTRKASSKAKGGKA